MLSITRNFIMIIILGMYNYIFSLCIWIWRIISQIMFNSFWSSWYIHVHCIYI